MKKELIRTSKDSSNSVMSCYSLREKRCWALIVDELQQYIDMDIDWETLPTEELRKIIPLTEFTYEYRVPLSLSKIDKSNPSDIILKSLREMTNLLINRSEFDAFVFINRISYDKITKQFFAYLPLTSLRWILDFGQKKRMFVTFHKPTFMKLSTSYSQNLFLLLSEFYSSGYIRMDLETFKNRMGCPASYDAKDIRDNILKRSLKEFERVNSTIGFAYCFSSSGKIKTVGRKKIDTIEIAISRIDENGNPAFNINNNLIDKKWEA